MSQKNLALEWLVAPGPSTLELDDTAEGYCIVTVEESSIVGMTQAMVVARFVCNTIELAHEIATKKVTDDGHRNSVPLEWANNSPQVMFALVHKWVLLLMSSIDEQEIVSLVFDQQEAPSIVDYRLGLVRLDWSMEWVDMIDHYVFGLMEWLKIVDLLGWDIRLRDDWFVYMEECYMRD